MLRVAIYCRLSEEDEFKSEGDDSQSIQNQKNLLTGYAFERGWEIYKIYSDDDWSGLDSDRPEWNEMLRDAKEHRFDVILCKSQSRFTRDMEVVERYLHNLFPIWNIRFIGVADYADTENRGNKKQRQINGLINEWYCEDVSQNIKVVFDKKRRDGIYIGNYATYGLKKDPNNKGKLLIDEPAAEVVRYIFQMYTEGKGTTIIAKDLNEKGIPNPTLYKKLCGETFVNASQKDEHYLWNRTTIRRMLKNKMYLGHMVQGVHRKLSYKSKKQIAVPREEWIVVENTHEAIIDQETFDLVEAMMSTKRRSDGKGEPYSLAGKVRCMDCGSTMTRITPESRKNKKKHKYLRCSLVEKKAGLCTGHYIRLDKLENIVLEHLHTYLKKASDDILKQRLDEFEGKGSVSKDLKTTLRKVEEEIADKNRVVQSLYSDKVAGIITPVQFVEFNDTFGKQIELLMKKKAGLLKKIEEKGDTEKKENVLLEKMKEFRNADKMTTRIAQEFIDFIEIGERNKKEGTQEIRIHWKY
ncbi:recombinase family protein [Sinanaerobacter sp. ZZT-01]|uniref:recombinase family protein n=1 Tax=Sinanaerobacter sp. ZZT-01 TaxID=3111540 RepID=UPI002D77E9E7|nr:recombinase family protein [Sinanaerobacter sp. ZZT-01]WRR93347.1 recombinase family protein [Sinanaerobacter sp. ZZT-01]